MNLVFILFVNFLISTHVSSKYHCLNIPYVRAKSSNGSVSVDTNTKLKFKDDSMDTATSFSYSLLHPQQPSFLVD
jgi:hypothetical protein